MNRYNLLENIAKENIAIIEKGKTYSYEELNKKVEEFERIIERRALCLCCTETSFNAISLYIASLRKGFVCILVPPKTDKKRLNEIRDIYNVTYIAREIEDTEEINAAEYIYSDGKFRVLRRENSAEKIAENIALLMVTSGSTGTPKMVIQSYKNIVSNTEAILKYLPINKDSRHITNLPLQYTYGLSCINTHLYAGGSIIVSNDSIATKEFWNTFDEHKPTSFSGVPYTYEILSKMGLNRIMTKEMEFITQAGGKMKRERKLEIYETSKLSGCSFYIMYGQTEATARMSYLPPEFLPQKIESIGIPISGGKFEIIKSDESQEKGEIVYSGDNVTLGYAKNKNDLLKEKPDRKVLETGDLGYKDDDGFYFITGRKSRMAKINGERIDLEYITELICRKTDMSCAVISDDKRIKIFIEKEELNTRETKEIVGKELKINKILIDVINIDEIPKTENGKTNYKTLEELC